MADEDTPTLAQQVRARREEAELTQADVAAYVGVNRVTIRALEQGRNVESRTLQKVVALLGCTITEATGHPRGILRPVLSAGLTRRIHRALAAALGELEEIAEGNEPTDGLRAAIVDAYLDLVEAAAAATEPEPKVALPPGLELLRSYLGQSEPQLRMVDAELSRIFGNVYPHRVAPTPPERTLAVLADGTAVRGDELEQSRQAVRIQESAPGAGSLTETRRRAGETEAGRGRRWSLAQARAMANGLNIVLDANLPSSVRSGLSEYLMIRAEDPDSRLVEEVRAMIATLEKLDLFPSIPLEE